MKIILFLLFSISVSAQKFGTIAKIAFGSCGSQETDLPIFDVIKSHHPDLFIFLGDNIYGDTDTMAILQKKYDQLKNKPSFKRLKTPYIGIWDDHDFGRNDAGIHYPFKKESKELFLKFFNEPLNSERRKRDGIYTSYYHKINNKTLQLILLDNRTFRNDLLLYTKGDPKPEHFFYDPDYVPHVSVDSAFLGEKQWEWLEKELKKPADIRLVCSGSQFGITYNGYEAWANFPHEQKRFLELIKKTKAEGLMFLSGDVHYGEISKLKETGMYPIYDVTSSGLSSTWLFATPNTNRIEGPIMENHFGLLTIDCLQKDPTLKMELWDVNNNQRVEYQIKLSELKFH